MAANEQQARYWHERSAHWLAAEARYDVQLRPFGERLLEVAAPTPPEAVLEVGCGAGATTVALGEALCPDGAVLAVDIASAMVAHTRQRAAEAGLACVEAVEADAQVHPFERRRFDVVVSRFGLMFFADPAAAFGNLARALRPGGRIAFACWQSADRNPWSALPKAAAAAHVAVPVVPPDAPGPLSLADPERIRALLAGAGFSGAGIEPFEVDLLLGGGGALDDAVGFVAEGSLATVLAAAGPAARDAAVAAVRDALAPYETARGVVMPAAAWLVTAATGPRT
jgi:SAM-dependent methyltransferase